MEDVRWPGLNEVLKVYEARHSINELKEKFHAMFK
jgi:hypothetical protein